MHCIKTHACAHCYVPNCKLFPLTDFEQTYHSKILFQDSKNVQDIVGQVYNSRPQHYFYRT